MESIRESPNARNTNDNQCGDEGCDTEASYTCSKHDYMLLCEECKDREHDGCETIKYYNPRRLFTQVRQASAIVKHIVKDCDLFKRNEIVEKILKEIFIYQQRVDELGKRVTGSIDSSSKDYRQISFELYSEACKIKNDIMESEMCQDWYSKLYIKHHFGDMSIFLKDEDQISMPGSESSASNTTDKAAGVDLLVEKLKSDYKLKESEYEEIIKVRDHQLDEYKIQVEELIADIKSKEAKISSLQNQLEETMICNSQSCNCVKNMCIDEENKNIEDPEEPEYDVEENNVKLHQAQEIYNQIYGTNETFDEDFWYEIRMDTDFDLKILEYTSQVKFPTIKSVTIYNISANLNAKLESLLKYSFPNRLKEFTIYCDDKEGLIYTYIGALAAISAKTTSHVCFDKPIMNYDQLSRIFKASKYTNTLSFNCLKFRKSGTINFGTHIDYNINKLKFEYIEFGRYRESSGDKSEFFRIFEEITHSNMHKKLQKLCLYKCNVDAKDVELPEVQVVNTPY